MKQMENESRSEYLARVVHEFMNTTCAGSEHMVYDEADCDGLCLADDIASELEHLKQQRDYLREVLRPFANMAAHFPQSPKYGNRPISGAIMAMNPGGDDEACITVEDLHRAKSAIQD